MALVCFVVCLDTVFMETMLLFAFKLIKTNVWDCRCHADDDDGDVLLSFDAM
jgi:hypothetical protein